MRFARQRQKPRTRTKGNAPHICSDLVSPRTHKELRPDTARSCRDDRAKQKACPDCVPSRTPCAASQRERPRLGPRSTASALRPRRGRSQPRTRAVPAGAQCARARGCRRAAWPRSRRRCAPPPGPWPLAPRCRTEARAHAVPALCQENFGSIYVENSPQSYIERLNPVDYGHYHGACTVRICSPPCGPSSGGCAREGTLQGVRGTARVRVRVGSR